MSGHRWTVRRGKAALALSALGGEGPRAPLPSPMPATSPEARRTCDAEVGLTHTLWTRTGS